MNGAYALSDNTADSAELFKRYKESGDHEIRNDLVMRYNYIAKTVAQQMRGIASNYADVEDVVNQGMLTLIDCVERFDPEKEVKFETYAFMRIRGAVIDFVRKQDWRPRRVRKTAKDVSAAYDELSNKFLREPTSKEISDFLNISEDELHKHYSEFSRAMVVSFESIVDNAINTENTQTISSDSDSPEHMLFRRELKEQLAMAIDALTEREKLVVSLYYYENLKLAEISKVLSVSESRVCQIHSKALGKLRGKIDKYLKG